MSTIYVELSQGWPDWYRKLFFERFAGTGFDVVEERGAPYFVASIGTLLNPVAMADFISRSSNRVTILDCAGEAFSPDLNIFDYSIGFDKSQFGDRLIYLPVNMGDYLDIRERCSKTEPEEKASKHKHFCSFIYSNNVACPVRNKLFEILNNYKPVLAPGNCCHNTDMFQELDDSSDWYASSVRIKSLFKFGIAAENAWHPYYTSEKIATTFLAGSVPIYWGNPHIEEDYNPDAFINAGLFGTAGELVEAVKRIDEDDEAYMRMLSAPCKTEQQEADYRAAYDRGVDMFFSIFTRPMGKALRRGFGTNTMEYRKVVYSSCVAASAPR